MTVAKDDIEADLDAMTKVYVEISQLVGRRGTEDITLVQQVRNALEDASFKRSAVITLKDGEWLDIRSAPKDGSKFLAWVEILADEEDEDGHIIRRGVIERYQVVAYWAFGGFVEFPWRGSFVQNMTWKKWRPLPADPEGAHG